MFEFIIGILTPMTNSFSDEYKKNKRYKSIEMPKYLIGRYLSVILWTSILFYISYNFLYNSWLMNVSFYTRFKGYSIFITYFIKIFASILPFLISLYLAIKNSEETVVKFGETKENTFYKIFCIVVNISIGTLYTVSIWMDKDIEDIWLHNLIAGNIVIIAVMIGLILLARISFKYFQNKISKP